MTSLVNRNVLSACSEWQNVKHPWAFIVAAPVIARSSSLQYNAVPENISPFYILNPWWSKSKVRACFLIEPILGMESGLEVIYQSFSLFRMMYSRRMERIFARFVPSEMLSAHASCLLRVVCLRRCQWLSPSVVCLSALSPSVVRFALSLPIVMFAAAVVMVVCFRVVCCAVVCLRDVRLLAVTFYKSNLLSLRTNLTTLNNQENQDNPETSTTPTTKTTSQL